jgi:hypothetical protein
MRSHNTLVQRGWTKIGELLMDFRSLLFWRRPPIADLEALADFIDTQASFLIQKGMNEYSRARAGHYAKVLFTEKEFLDALDWSRWSAFPLGLAMVGEMVEGVLRPHAADPARQLEALVNLVVSIFDRYPTPAPLTPESWSESRAELVRQLQSAGLHAPKRVMDIARPYARTYWDLMPIKKEIRTADFPTTRSYLMVMLCNVHDELVKRSDLPALAALLAGGEAAAVQQQGLAG